MSGKCERGDDALDDAELTRKPGAGERIGDPRAHDAERLGS